MSGFTRRHSSGRLIVRQHDDWCVLSTDGEWVLSKHKTPEDALAWCDERFAPGARQLRMLTLHGAVGEIRTATYDNREHLVVPVVALMEGVIWPMNAPGPELVTRQILSVAPGGWNGRPCVGSHPMDTASGRPISANDPRTLETQSFGTVFNTELRDGVKLFMEAWLDPARAERVGSEAHSVLQRAQNHEPIEVSVGALVVAEERSGVFDGKKYSAVWIEMVPDHLALLPEGATGACSNEMGCGAPRAAVRHFVAASGNIEMDPATMPAEEQDVPAAPAAAAAAAAPAPQPAAAAQEGTMKDRDKRIKGLLARPHVVLTQGLISALLACTDQQFETVEAAVAGGAQIALDVPKYVAAEDGVSDVDLRNALDRALRSTEPGYLGIDSVFPNDKSVVYATAPEDVIVLIQRSFDMSAEGEVSLGADRQEVRPVTRFEPIAAAGAHQQGTQPCGCGGKGNQAAGAAAAAEEVPMDRKERVKALIENKRTPFAAADQKYLEGLTDERLTEIETQAAATETEVATAKDKAVAAEGALAAAQAEATTARQAAAAAAAPKSEEQYLADAPQPIRDIVSRFKAQEAARKDALVTSLVAAQTVYSKDELMAKDPAELERLAKLAGAAAPAVDFSINAPPRAAAESSDGAPEPIDLGARIRAQRGADGSKAGAAA